MAYGKAVIGTEVGGIPEIITNGFTGILTQSGNVDELEKAMFKLISDTEYRMRLGLNARNSVYQRFSSDQMVKKSLSIYEGVILNSN
jgi:glycosyltransferase involved in cell wall biosynthesis